MQKEILVNGRKIVYFEEGEGYPFLIIHGWGPKAVQRFWSFQKTLAAQKYRVILLTLPGFEDNGSGVIAKWGMQDYLNCISDFMNALGLEECFLIGHSMGGAVAIRLAALHPQRIRILILLSPGILHPVKSRFWEWWLFLSGLHAFLAITWFIDKSCHRFFSSRNKIMCKILKNVVAVENTILYLPKINQPTIIFWGRRDYNYYLFGRSSVKQIPHHLIHIMPGTGHNIQEAAPDKTIELILEFIGSPPSIM